MTGSGTQPDEANAFDIDASGNIYIVDNGNNVIRKVSSSGIISTFAGSGAYGSGGDGGLATAAAFKSPWGISVDPSGNIYIADYFNHRIRKVNTAWRNASACVGVACQERRALAREFPKK